MAWLDAQMKQTEAKEAAVGGLHDSKKVSCWESRVNSSTNVANSTAHLTACDNLRLEDVISGSPLSWQAVWLPWHAIQQLSTFVCLAAVFHALSAEAVHLTCWHEKNAVHPPTLLCQWLFPVHKFYSNAPMTLTKLDTIRHHSSLTFLQQGSGAWSALEMGSV